MHGTVNLKLQCTYDRTNGPDSSVSIATGYRLDGVGIESRWGARFSAPVQTGPGAHPASCTMGTGSFPGLKSSWGVMLTPHPLLVPWSWKGRAIPLLPLWAVWPVQSLSACTGVTFNFTFYDRTSIIHKEGFIVPTKWRHQQFLNASWMGKSWKLGVFRALSSLRAFPYMTLPLFLNFFCSFDSHSTFSQKPIKVTLTHSLGIKFLINNL